MVRKSHLEILLRIQLPKRSSYFESKFYCDLLLSSLCGFLLFVYGPISYAIFLTGVVSLVASLSFLETRKR